MALSLVPTTSMPMAPEDGASLFTNALPASRLGTGHASLQSYTEAVEQRDDGSSSSSTDDNRDAKEFSLVVLLAPQPQTTANERHNTNNSNSSSTMGILLGEKKRGFGTEFYNSFGGKLEPGEDERPALGSVQEIREAGT